MHQQHVYSAKRKRFRGDAIFVHMPKQNFHDKKKMVQVYNHKVHNFTDP